MVAFTMAMLSKLSNKSIDFESIWEQQAIISPSLFKDLGGDVMPLYAKALAGNKNITYKVKSSVTTSNGKKRNKCEVKSVAESELNKIEDTVLYKIMKVVAELQSKIWDILMNVDEGTNISVNTKRASCWTDMCQKNILKGISLPSDVLTSNDVEEMTPAMLTLTEKANSYDYETWHDINIWGKETGLISPRDAAFMGSIYYWCKRGKELTYKQARYALRVLDNARSKGWEE